MRLRGISKVTDRKSLWLGILFLFIVSCGMPAFAATETINYTYDDLYRLTQVASDIGYSEQYTYDEVGNRLSFELSAANISVSQTPFDLGNTSVGEPATQRYTVTNSGTMVLLLSSMNITGPDAGQFSQSSDCSTLLPSGSCSIDVTFLPDSAGPKNATISISSNDPDTPTMEVALMGTGVSTLTFSVTPASGGTVTGTNIDCPGDCVETYNTSGASVQLTATPNTGYHFVSWSGDTGGSNNPVDLLMDVNKSVTANFSVSAYTISTSADANGSIICSPNPVEYDTSSTCTISPNTGFGIYTVTVDDIEQSPAPSSYTFNNVQAEHSIAATFADTIAPVLTVSTLSGNSWTSNGTLNISGDVFDGGSGLQGLTINGVPATVNPDSSFSHAVVLAEGANNITVIATDNNSNTTTDTRTINYDPYAPVITIDQPVDNSKTNNQSVTVSGYVDDYSEVTGVTNNLLPLTFSFNGEDGAFSASEGLTYGTNTIEVGASDLALNTATAKRTVTYDNLAPSLSVTQPPQDITTSQSSLDVQGTVSDLTIPTVTMTVDGGAPETLAVTTGQFAKTVTFTSEKTYVIQVTAVDEAGNSSTVTRNIIYHYAPEANFNTNVNYSASYTLDFNASVTTCPSGYACAYLWDFDDDGNEDAAGITATHTFAGSGPYPVTLTVTTNALTVDSITKNVTPVAINVVKLPPTAAHTSLVSPVVKGSPVSFVDASMDNNHESIAGIYVNWGDGNVETGYAAATFSHTYANSGKYTIIHTATDAGGRMASEFIPVQVTLTAGTKTKITVNVTQSDAATPITGARIYLKKAGVPVTTGYSNIAGTWTFSNLAAADDYTVEVYKSGVDFGNGKGKAGAKVPADTSAPMDVTLDISSVNP